jgi:hypothetical protein
MEGTGDRLWLRRGRQTQERGEQDGSNDLPINAGLHHVFNSRTVTQIKTTTPTTRLSFTQNPS